MTTFPTDEQVAFRDSLRQYFRATSPQDEVRRQMATVEGYERASWAKACRELGLAAVGLPEEYGGLGGTPVDAALVFEEAGRALFCGPLFSTVALGANAILASGDRAMAERFLPSIAAGELTCAVAVLEAATPWTPRALGTTGSLSGDHWSVRGSKLFVVDAMTADHLLVLADTDGGPTLFVVDRRDPAVRVEAMSTLDETRKQARVTMAAAAAEPVGRIGAAWDTVATMTDAAIVALTAEQVGGAQRVLETAVEYASHRRQFGRVIGSFQAIKHRCADMLIDVEEAREAAAFAAWSAAEAPAELPHAASLAKVSCSEAFERTAAANIQIHGGIGFTWEHSAHLYFKRAKSDHVLLGGPDVYRERLVALMQL